MIHIPANPAAYIAANHVIGLSLARFLVSYAIGSRSYKITIPGQSAAAIRQGWTSWHRGATLLSVVECDANGLPV